MVMHPVEIPVAPATQVADDVARALAEDIGTGDATADLLDPDDTAHARVLCREAATLAGRPWFDAVFRAIDPQVDVHWHAKDGERVAADTVLCELRGRARALVSGERSALNFLQLLSGTATATAAYVDAVQGTRARILDTRKTIPGLRVAQKYAVRCGGGVNHRIGLFDAVLIKENHVIAHGSIAGAVARARQLHPALPLICEVETMEELRQAMAAGVDRVLIDEFPMDDMRAAVKLANGGMPIEVSGGVTLDTVAAIAATGVDYISIGALTKHLRAIDLSMRMVD
jgi:nicotinate-nucleotide pyrophosphorylase (carboxylating)